MTAIEVWLVTSIGFIFFSLIELGIVMQTIAWIDGGSKKYKILGEKNQEQEDINLPGNLALTYN